MAVVTEISSAAQKALRENEKHFEFGYGDAYHFTGIPGKTSVDIAEKFEIRGIAFVVRGETLFLESEIKQQKETPESVKIIQALLLAMNTVREQTRDVSMYTKIRMDLKKHAPNGVVFRLPVLGYVLVFKTLIVWEDGYDYPRKDENNG